MEPKSGVERKRLAMALPEATHEQRVARFRELQDATAQLRPFTAERLNETGQEIHEIERVRNREAIYAARDYSFCLYPEEMLRRFMGLQPGCCGAAGLLNPPHASSHFSSPAAVSRGMSVLRGISSRAASHAASRAGFTSGKRSCDPAT